MVMESTNNKLDESEEFVPSGFVDIHCHCLPGVDDGPSTKFEAIELCRAMVDDGVGVVIATPHQLGQFSDCNEAEQIRKIVSAFNEELKSNDIALTVAPGGDVRVDERICQLLKDDKILTLADNGTYILLELPHQVFIDIEPLIVELASAGIQSIISHPERHPVLADNPKILLKWLNHSVEFSVNNDYGSGPVHLQITAASLLGGFGSMAQKAAWNFLKSGWASLVATDAHNLTGRRPCMKAAFELICNRLGESVARLVCIENPSRVLNGEDIVDISPIGTGKCNYERGARNS